MKKIIEDRIVEIRKAIADHTIEIRKLDELPESNVNGFKNFSLIQARKDMRRRLELNFEALKFNEAALQELTSKK